VAGYTKDRGHRVNANVFQIAPPKTARTIRFYQNEYLVIPLPQRTPIATSP
jgi:hypothetical protein